MGKRPWHARIVGVWLALIGSAAAVPCLAQTVIPNTPAQVRDSAARASADTAAKRKPPADKKADKVSVRPDTTLAAACAGMGKGGVAQDLVVVVFGPEIGADERAATIKRAGGVLLPRPDAADDSYYVRLREADSQQALADRLIQLSQIRSVGFAPCPSPPPPSPPSPLSDTGRSKEPSPPPVPAPGPR